MVLNKTNFVNFKNFTFLFFESSCNSAQYVAICTRDVWSTEVHTGPRSSSIQLLRIICRASDGKVIFTFVFVFILSYLSYFSFQPVLHDWCNKGRGMCYPVCGMVHIKEPLLLIDKIAYVAAAGFLSHYQNGP